MLNSVLRSPLAVPFQTKAGLISKIRAMFSTAAQNVLFTPSDITTLFQDAAGTKPVTAVGQPVGLMLDKSKGLVLGAQLVTGATFTANSANTVGIVNGVTFTAAAVGANASFTAGLVTGKFYEVTYTVSGLSSGSVFVDLGGATAGVVRSANGTYTERRSASGGSTFYVTSNTAGTTATITVSSIREIPGNHAFNPSGNSANFPVLSARYNLLTKTEQFDDVAWLVSNTLVTADTVNAPNGTLTADKIYETSATGVFLRYQSVMPGAGTYTMTVYAKSAERSKFALEYASSTPAAVFDLANGSVFSTTNCNAKITSAGSGWYICSMTATVAAGSTSVVSIRDASGNRTYTGDGISGIYIWGADLRVTNDALNQPAYQRVNTATDYDTVGFKPYLSFNGVNQWLQTNNIDFSYGDKMFVSAGVRKLSDAARAIPFEFGLVGTSSGSFNLNAPEPPYEYDFSSQGTSNAIALLDNSTYTAPITNVLSGIGNISGAQSILRVNGAQAAISTADQGTGNYGSYPLYIGARAGSTLWFNGRLYGLVVAGKQASASEITSTETYLNTITGAY